MEHCSKQDAGHMKITLRFNTNMLCNINSVMLISLCACVRMRWMGSNLPEHLHVTLCAHLYV